MPRTRWATRWTVPLGGEPAEIDASLWAVQIDTQDRFEAAWRDVQRYLIDMLARGGVDPITADELTVLPGVEEVLALLAVRELAATGRLGRARRRLRADGRDAAAARPARGARLVPAEGVPDASAAGPRHAAARRVARPGRGDPARRRVSTRCCGSPTSWHRCGRCSADPTLTTVRLVLTPESVVTAETRRTFTALALYGYAVDLIIANRVFPSGRRRVARRAGSPRSAAS